MSSVIFLESADDLLIEEFGPGARVLEDVPLICTFCVAPGPVTEAVAAGSVRTAR